MVESLSRLDATRFLVCDGKNTDRMSERLLTLSRQSTLAEAGVFNRQLNPLSPQKEGEPGRPPHLITGRPNDNGLKGYFFRFVHVIAARNWHQAKDSRDAAQVFNLSSFTG